MYHTGHIIHGQAIPYSDQKTIPITNPATGNAIGTVAIADAALIDAAVESAERAFPAWSNTPAAQRAKILFKFRDILTQRIEELATIVCNEHGKTVTEAKQSMGRGIECVEFACGIPRLLQGQYSENVARSVDCYTLRQPLGVCLGISPFNFPVMVPIWCFIHAIACGNTCILKPSPQDPTCSNRLAQWLLEAGAPAGILNVLHGDKDTVDQLLQHPGVKAVTAVASTAAAHSIYLQATQNGKRAQTFGGAKNHGIVMPDANLDHAAEQICQAAFGSAGERCMALSVAIVVGTATADRFIDRLSEKTQKLVVGPGDKLGTDIGPVISAAHRDKVLSYIDIGCQEGAKLLIDKRKISVSGYENGFYVGPCLFDHVTPTMRIYREEIFGPVLSIVRVPDFATALSLTNSHRYGNGTAIFTSNGKTARDFASLVQVGMIGINVPIPVPVSFHRFGGWKDSFFGDVEMHAEQSILFYTKGKSVTVTWPEQEKS